MTLSDLSVLIEPDQEYQKNQTSLCTTMSFLLGVPWDLCKHYCEENEDVFQELDQKSDARVMRALCNLRSNLMLLFNETSQALRYDLKGLKDLDWCKSEISTLAREEIYLEISGCDINKYIAEINKIIVKRIESIRVFFPEWIKWEYIKSLFLMPKGQKLESIQKESKKYRNNRSLYPYKRYIHWEPYDCGNILISDSKFAKVLYDINDDYFFDYSKVKDAKESDVKSIYDFIGESGTVQLFVDCENSDVFKLASVLSQLNRDETEKIDRIVLYDDIHTTDAWRYLDKMTNIPIEHIIVERIKENKSLVDMRLGMGISKAFYENNVSSFILLSSDSDFWGVISSLPDTRFLVMVERSKCGPDLQRRLENEKIFYCFIDDFCSANISCFKENLIRTALENEVDKLLDANAKSIINQIFYRLRLNASDTEKRNFYDKFVKKLKLSIDKDANMRIKLSA